MVCLRCFENVKRNNVTQSVPTYPIIAWATPQCSVHYRLDYDHDRMSVDDAVRDPHHHLHVVRWRGARSS
jgi:hypothetical protein